MAGTLRKLNDEGIAQFRAYLMAGAQGPAPLGLLGNIETSEPVSGNVVPGTGHFSDRYEFGIYLRTLFAGLDPAVIANDQGLWSGLALLWFDRLCPPDAGGHRAPDKEYRYVLSADYRHYYRHLVRSPWQLVRDHGQNARFLLISPKEQKNPLGVHGEILEQFGGRQQVLASRPIVAAANRMYLDPKTGRPRTGVAGSGRGSARRFGMVLRQLDLTFDPECMNDGRLEGLLPGEFDRWKSKTSQPVAQDKPQLVQAGAAG
jgi:hypothetical protein